MVGGRTDGRTDVEFYRQEYWRVGSHSLFPEALPDAGIKPGSPALQADSLSSEPPGNSSPL